jgi:hypothetical protein
LTANALALASIYGCEVFFSCETAVKSTKPFVVALPFLFCGESVNQKIVFPFARIVAEVMVLVVVFVT